MSTRGTILLHYDKETKVEIHLYQELVGDSSQDIRMEIQFEHTEINIPWPVGLSLE